MSKRKGGPTPTHDFSGACGDIPPWISRSATLPPPRMRCCRPKGHSGKHLSAQDHCWKRDGIRPNREARR